MYLGKTLFAQIMEFLPWKTFHRIVDRYSGDYRTRSLSCAEQFRVMAFAQLTYRESLRDIEVCLAAQAGKLSILRKCVAGRDMGHDRKNPIRRNNRQVVAEVLCGQDRDHPRRGLCLVRVYRPDQSVSLARPDDRRMC